MCLIKTARLDLMLLSVTAAPEATGRKTRPAARHAADNPLGLNGFSRLLEPARMLLCCASKGSIMATAPVQLGVRNIHKSFAAKAGEVHVLDGLSFDIHEQDFVSIIVGPSGCGKSTVFNIIAGLIEPDDGTLVYRGEEISSLRGRVGYMMQKDLLFPWRTVLENVLLGLEMRGRRSGRGHRCGAQAARRVRSRGIRERLSQRRCRAACGSGWR